MQKFVSFFMPFLIILLIVVLALLLMSYKKSNGYVDHVKGSNIFYFEADRIDVYCSGETEFMIIER